MEKGTTFRILSLSGGGIRGIFQAVYLNHIVRQLNRPLRESFDLIAGTSTGAIIALGVALGIDLNRIVDLFETHGEEIFPYYIHRASRYAASYFGKGPRYDQKPLRSALASVFIEDGGARQLQLRDCKPPVLVAAATLDEYRIHIFTTLPTRGGSPTRDGELFAADVALASAAAPLFFPAAKTSRRGADGKIEVDERTYVDGGVWANNPTFFAVLSAHRQMGVPFDNMRVVSIGNGEMPLGSVGVDFNKLRRARMISPVLDIMFSTQSQLSDLSAAHLLDDESMSGKRMLRINTQLNKFIDLDDVRAAISVLKPLAEQVAENTVDQFKKIMDG